MNDKMIFNNIETLKISGNEVQSIITLNGEIIYQKEEDNDYILIQNNNVIEDYADIYTLSDVYYYFSYNNDISEVKLTLPTATKCYDMFMGCSALTSADLSLPNATDCGYMFYNCSALTSVDLSLLSATDCNRMFMDCSTLTDVKLNLPNLSVYDNMFRNASNLETIDVTIPSNLVNDFKYYIFSLGLEHLKSLIINGVDNDYILIQKYNAIEDYADIYTLSDLSSYFRYNTDINKVKLTLPTATECFAMFWQCSALTSADLNLPNATNCNYMFYYCSTLTSIDLSLPNAANCRNMFNGCSALTDIKLNMPNLSTYNNVFDNCPNLKTIDVTIPTNKVNDFKSYIDSLNLEHLTSLIINGHQYIEHQLYYDDASVDNTARYTPCVVEGGSPKTIQFDTDKYYFPNSSGRNTAFVSSVNVSNNCVIEADLYKLEDNGSGLGIGFSKVTASGKANYNGLAVFGGSVSWYGYGNQSWNTSNYWNRNISENVTNKWIHIEIVRNENDVTITFTNTNGDIIFNTTGTVASFVQGEDCYLALFSSSVTGYIKNIKVTEISEIVNRG